jgi:hypothetical protein
MHGQEDDLRSRQFAKDPPGGADSIDEGHGQIKDGNVGVELSRKPDGFIAIRSFSCHLKAFMLKQRPQPLTHDFMVISQ